MTDQEKNKEMLDAMINLVNAVVGMHSRGRLNDEPIVMKALEELNKKADEFERTHEQDTRG